jgi:hypothetical protein
MKPALVPDPPELGDAVGELLRGNISITGNAFCFVDRPPRNEFRGS